MRKSSVTPIDLLHNASNYITLKLDDTNYMQWSYQVEKFLKVYRLSSFLDGTVMVPVDPDADAYLEWEAMDTAILNLIAASLSDDAFSEMMNCKSATEAWTTLRDRYSSISELKIMHLKNNLHGMQKGTDSMDVYWKKVRATRQQLSTAGHSISDQYMILIILKGLSVEYNHFKSHICARPVRVTLPELRDLLLEEESDLDAASKSFNPPIMTAMVAQKGTVSSSPPVAHGDNFHSGSVDRGCGNPNWQTNWNRRPNYHGHGPWSRGRSWNNGGRGGSWNNGGSWNAGGNNGPNWNGPNNQWNQGGNSGSSYGQWNQGPGPWNNNAGSWNNNGGPWHHGGNSGPSQYFVTPNSSPGVLSSSPTAPPVSIASSSPVNETCQICLQFGHTAPNCPQRTNFSYQGTPPSPALTALTATASGQFSDLNIWLTDSGATNHMTSDLRLLSNIAPSTFTDNVTIGSEGENSVSRKVQ
ncbi:uncharacterized protein LOC110766125 [Prunus avium]|uniref:Uncharacterized protein LOC110766125 n=1 Tax=Prunus avium TaxID=42229 RepID=A0A6P5TDB5_PRUAV|nr:uncharacterized protein LOC110766125 [Prunus avium]